MEHAAVMKQIRHEERNTRVPAYQGLGIGMNGGMHADMRFSIQKLGSKGSVLRHRQAELLVIELDSPGDVENEDGDTVQGGNHHAGTHRRAFKTYWPTITPRATIPTSSTTRL